MNMLPLAIVALLPPLAFLFYIYRLDKLEPEPVRLVVKAIALGGIAVIPAGIAETLLARIPALSMGGYLGAAVKSFAIISPVEEALKLAVVMLFIWNDRNFNEENDGIVYVGSAAIGFSMVENVLYVAQSGLFTGIMRAVTAIPLHTFTGVIMGYFVGIARLAPGTKGRGKYIWTGFAIAYVTHGAYDTFVFSGTAAAFLVIPLVIVLFVFGIIYLKKGAALSARRWGAPPPTAVPAPECIETAVSVAGTYKIVISRIIFALCAGFWAILILGIIEQSTTAPPNLIEPIVGGIMLSIIPMAIGVVLETSYRRVKNRSATGA
ncbi:MAG: PrsW family intramembrane metalloprotease [Spirochaetes bacterium]|nr:PrsW family intramembrane metalloprotease [Spirochaetota bacterium]